MSFVKLDIDELEFFERLGGGASGSVYRAKWKTRDKIVAAKKLLTMDKEPEVLSSLSHRNIVQFFGAVTQSPDFCIITEYAELGSLYDFLRKNSLEYSLMLQWAKQIALGMNYLHYEAPIPVIHRDLKSKNVVIAMDLTAKICDFGSSKFHSHTTKMTLVGTFPWMAPEVIQQLPATPSCDVYSYSVVLWELLTDEVPFAGLEGMQVAWLVVAKNQRLMIPNTCPPSFSILMKRCWETEPKKRPTFKQILEAVDSMLEKESLKEETDNFLKDKSTWKSNLDAHLKELQLAQKDLSQKQQELDDRERLLKQRENDLKLQRKMSTLGSSKEDLEPHDVSSWSQDDVANWVFHLSDELGTYADLFVKNNISGRQLFLLTGDDLLQIGILSVGHRKQLLDEINKLKTDNYRLLNFPPLPNAPTTCPARPLSITGKEETLTVLFGALYKLHGETYRWKMLIDFEGSHSVTTSIKEVVFHCSQTSKGERQTLHNPPFITGSWIKKSMGEPIECTIKFKESVVLQPSQTVFTFQLKDTQAVEERTVKLEMVKRERNPSGGPVSNDSSTLSPSTSVHRLSGIWLDRNQLLSVPPSESVDGTVKWTSSPFTPDVGAADTVTSSLSSVASIKEPSLSKDLGANQSSLQGAWGSSNTTAAAMIKKNISSQQGILPSRPITPSGGRETETRLSISRLQPNLRKSTSSPGPPGGGEGAERSSMWTSKQQNYGRSDSESSDKQRRDKRYPRGGYVGGSGRGRGGKKSGTGYQRSVSDVTSSGQQSPQQRHRNNPGGKTSRGKYHSEPNKRN